MSQAYATLPGERPVITERLTRGIRRHLKALGLASLAEFSLANGRRADILAIGADCKLTIVEVKSSLADYRADQKWQDYLPHCDHFYFAVESSFPLELIPDEVGLMVGDEFGAEILRPSIERPLPAARRRKLMLEFGWLAASRLHRIEDPALGLETALSID
ncbi:MAG TPA: MmcB family DNA repair protein [Alphaproteobacteria bacterium]|nr:MmcB family DNA repair protein [Alphaproteobacteria bacterium]